MRIGCTFGLSHFVGNGGAGRCLVRWQSRGRTRCVIVDCRKVVATDACWVRCKGTRRRTCSRHSRNVGKTNAGWPLNQRWRDGARNTWNWSALVRDPLRRVPDVQCAHGGHLLDTVVFTFRWIVVNWFVGLWNIHFGRLERSAWIETVRAFAGNLSGWSIHRCTQRRRRHLLSRFGGRSDAGCRFAFDRRATFLLDCLESVGSVTVTDNRFDASTIRSARLHVTDTAHASPFIDLIATLDAWIQVFLKDVDSPLLQIFPKCFFARIMRTSPSIRTRRSNTGPPLQMLLARLYHRLAVRRQRLRSIFFRLIFVCTTFFVRRTRFVVCRVNSWK